MPNLHWAEVQALHFLERSASGAAGGRSGHGRDLDLLEVANLNAVLDHHAGREENTIEGACLCGAVRWTFDGPPDGATACNCTACRRYGALWAYDFDGEGIKVSGATESYSRGNNVLSFHFCSTCRCVTYWRSRTDEPGERRRIAVNLRLADPESVATIPIDHFDGQSGFRDLPRDGKCVVAYWL